MLMLTLTACLRPVPVAQAPERTEVELAAVLDSFDDSTVAAPPEALSEVLSPELERRNLVPVSADPALITSFAQIRATDARRAALSKETAPVLLVECAPRFSAQVNGRYRWSVEVDLSLGELPTRSFVVPVHLLYAHEDEDEAAAEAAPMVARELGRLLDDWLALAASQ
jgi:hypothetical protein